MNEAGKASVAAARAAGPRSATDSKPGMARRRRERGGRYLDATRMPVRDTGTLRRIRAIAMPPAWHAVWINPDPRGHLQAIGRDARGRK